MSFVAEHDPQAGAEGEGNNDPHSPASPGDDDGERLGKGGEEKLKTGRRKINIEFIEDKSRRHITFSKRKAGIMKKAYELSTLTGTQVLLLVASETGHVYTFATPKLQPLITKPEGKNLIQSCLNAPEVAPAAPTQHPTQHRIQGYNDPPIMYPTSEISREMGAQEVAYDEEKKAREESKGSGYPLGMAGMADYSGSSTYPPPNLIPGPYSMASMASVQRGYMGQYGSAAPHSQYAQSNQVQGQYAQQQAYAQGYPPTMHGMPGWQNKPGMQGMPMPMSQAQASAAQSPSAISGIIGQGNKQDHAGDHST